MKLVSLFDGIAGFALGFCRATGQDPKDFHYYASEIEKFPMAVARKNFQKVEELGDVKTVRGDRIRPKTSDEQGQPEQPATGRPVPLPTQGWDSDTDFICTFGSPCQDLSVAGKQQGLDGERSGLFYEAIRVIRELRPRPKYFVWENVAGALSSNNREDFASVIQAIADIGYDSCYTVLDAQWFGVPQRRRRIFLVGVRDGIPAGTDLLAFSRRATPTCREQISLITKSRGGNSKESGKARQETPDNPQESPGGRSFVIDREAGQSVAGPISGNSTGGYRNDLDNCGAYPLEHPDPVLLAHGQGDAKPNVGVCPTLNCNHEQPIAFDIQTNDGGQHKRKDRPEGGMYVNETETSLTIGSPDQTKIVQDGEEAISGCDLFNGTITGDISMTVKGQRIDNMNLPTVMNEGDKRQIVATTGDCTHALTARGDSSEDGTGRGTPIVATIMATGQANAEISQEACPTLNCGAEQPIAAITPASFYGQMKAESQCYREDGTCNTLINGTNPGHQNHVMTPIIRRLTPVECLHLQGFPSDYFDDVPGYSDTQAYKAIGNSIAVPCVEWIFRRILEFDNDHAG